MRHPLSLIGGLLLAVILTGCSNDPEPITLPPVTSTPSASPTPSVSPSPKSPSVDVVKPPLADEVSPEGLDAFATYYYAVLTHSGATGDTRLLESLSDPSCMTCAAYAQAVRTRVENGDTREGGEFEVVSAISPGLDPTDDLPALTVNLRITPGQIRHSDGTTDLISPDSGEVTMQVKRTGAGWLVLRIVTQ